MNMTDEQLADRVRSHYGREYLSSKGEIVEYYKETYGSRWESQAARDLAGGQTSGKDYKNARRNFEGGRAETNPRSSKDKAKWAALGRKLPPAKLIPPKRVAITFRGSIKVSGGRKDAKGRLRGNGYAKASFTRTLEGPDVANPTFEALFAAYWGTEESPVLDWDVQALSVRAG